MGQKLTGFRRVWFRIKHRMGDVDLTLLERINEHEIDRAPFVIADAVDLAFVTGYSRLRKRGLVEQVGKDGPDYIYRITEAGRTALSSASKPGER